MEGGHDVPISKIVSRYYKSVHNSRIVGVLADRFYVYDNSTDGADPNILFRLNDGKLIKKYEENLPEWALQILKTSDEISLYETNSESL